MTIILKEDPVVVQEMNDRWRDYRDYPCILTTDEILQKFVDHAVSIGANGILNFRLETIEKSKAKSTTIYNVTTTDFTNSTVGYRLTGFAVYIPEK